MRNGKKQTIEAQHPSGYILVEAIPEKFSGEIINAISNLTNVIHFLGKTNPIPMTQQEAKPNAARANRTNHSWVVKPCWIHSW